MTTGTAAGIPMDRRDERAVIPVTAAPRQALRVLLSLIAESRANYCASYAIDLACPLALGYLGMRRTTGGWLIPLAGGCAGLASFTFVEYAIHRWLFHRPSSTMGAVHQAHHDAPHDHAALPCITSAVVAVVAWWVLSAMVGSAAASFFLCGLMSGYFCYATLHHFEHSIRINALPCRFLQQRLAAHAVHHRLGDVNYGVTTSFWDRMLGTGYKARRKSSPQRARHAEHRRRSIAPEHSRVAEAHEAGPTAILDVQPVRLSRELQRQLRVRKSSLTGCAAVRNNAAPAITNEPSTSR